MSNVNFGLIIISDIRSYLWPNALCMFADLSCMVSFHLSFAYACGLQPAARSSILLGVHTFPYELGVLHTVFCLRRLNGWFTPGLQIILNANTVRPPLLGGYLVHLTTATLLPTEDGRLLSSASFGLMHKYI